MRSGKLNILSFGAGTIPFASKAYPDGNMFKIKVQIIVKKDSPYQRIDDLREKKKHILIEYQMLDT